MQRAKYELEEYDRIALREAKQRIMVVYNYHYGARRSGSVVRRLKTIVDKIDHLIKEGEKDHD